MRRTKLFEILPRYKSRYIRDDSKLECWYCEFKDFMVAHEVCKECKFRNQKKIIEDTWLDKKVNILKVTKPSPLDGGGANHFFTRAKHISPCSDCKFQHKPCEDVECPCKECGYLKLKSQFA